MTTQEQLTAAKTELEALTHFKTGFESALQTELTKLEKLKADKAPLEQQASSKAQVLGLQSLIEDQQTEIDAQREKIKLLETAVTQEAEQAQLADLMRQLQTMLDDGKNRKVSLLRLWKGEQAATVRDIERGSRILTEAQQLFLRTEARAGRAFEPRQTRDKLGNSFPIVDQFLTLDRVPAPPRLGGGVDLDPVVF